MDIPKSIDYDVIVIGAGIAGINFAYRLQERNPDLSYCILESRHELGGTWSFFRYPGLRSDSDLHTFGFPWRPWTETEPIAQGHAIMQYMRKAAADEGILPKIRFNHKVTQISWSSNQKLWEVDGVVNGDFQATLRSNFILLATGYYDYEQPLETHIPGISNFTGDVIHPQFWPDQLAVEDKNIVVIGSGATAITILPTLADAAKHVTMLQRSPSYILSIPTHDPLDEYIRSFLPMLLATKIIRLKWIILPSIFRKLSIMFPEVARNWMLKVISQELKEGEFVDPNFRPKYNPFEQRMCLSPGGDFYQCLRNGKAGVKTGTIEMITESTIKLSSGEVLRPDMIVTATGLQLRLGGGIKILVDGDLVVVPDKYVWKGLMLEEIPNLVFSFGYLDAAWTLAVDISAKLACRLLNQMRREQVSIIVPRLNLKDEQGSQDIPYMPLKSTYVQKGLSALPKLKDCRQWGQRSFYLWELFMLPLTDIRSGLQWIKNFE